MSRKRSSFDSTLLPLDGVCNNLYAKIDTRGGYEFQRVLGYQLDRGFLRAVVYDTINGFRYITLASTTGMLNENGRDVLFLSEVDD
jgi:hypothetical protein